MGESKISLGKDEQICVKRHPKMLDKFFSLQVNWGWPNNLSTVNEEDWNRAERTLGEVEAFERAMAVHLSWKTALQAILDINQLAIKTEWPVKMRYSQQRQGAENKFGF